MTQEEKQLLLQDLCARLPYKICAKQYYSTFEDDFIIEGIIGEQIYAAYNSKISMVYPVEKIKPYLRQMSSMTEDERKEFIATQYEEVIEQYPCSAAPSEIKILSYTAKTFDWLNANHFDYHGLILKGLALKAPEEMY